MQSLADEGKTTGGLLSGTNRHLAVLLANTAPNTGTYFKNMRDMEVRLGLSFLGFTWIYHLQYNIF
jgi:hypothetical protein